MTEESGLRIVELNFLMWYAIWYTKHISVYRNTVHSLIYPPRSCNRDIMATEGEYRIITNQSGLRRKKRKVHSPPVAKQQ